ncbi:MAG TPA: Ig-like domain-containing protein [Candidatus Tectomicrobia bacterium]
MLTPAALKLVRRSGDGQTVVVGRTLAQPLVVAVQNQQGQPESGQAVTFTITAGQGTLAADLVTTDATGQASATLTLGRNAGGRLQVEASVDGLTVIFTAIGVADRDHPILRPVANLEQEAEQGGWGSSIGRSNTLAPPPGPWR